MIHVALAEDDPLYRQTLQEYLDRFAAETGQKFIVSAFVDGSDLVEGYKANYDIILMDVEMSFLDGITAAQEIRHMDSEVVIIFITNMPQYAMKGYTVDALDYVLKPITYFAFSQRIRRALERMHRRRSRYVSVNIKNGFQKVDVGRITYVEVLDHDLIYHTLDGDITVRGTINEAAAALGEQEFYRCSKSYLVNLEHVDGFVDNDILVAGAHIKVSRAKKKEFLDRLNVYINEVSK